MQPGALAPSPSREFISLQRRPSAPHRHGSRAFSDDAEAPLLQAWLAEVRRHPLLTREEEVELARRMRQGDARARRRLVQANLRLVLKLALEHHRPPMSLLDLIQEGNLGLVLAVERFDPERGVRLFSYAAWWIRAYLLRFILENQRLVKLATTDIQRKLFFKLRQAQYQLRAQGLEATPRQLAARLEVPEKDVVEMNQRMSEQEVRLDAPLRDDDGPETRQHALPSGEVPVEERLGQLELERRVGQEVDRFARKLHGRRERDILKRRLTAEEPETLVELGKRFHVTRERARQVEASLLKQLRTHLRETLPDFDWLATPSARRPRAA